MLQWSHNVFPLLSGFSEQTISSENSPQVLIRIASRNLIEKKDGEPGRIEIFNLLFPFQQLKTNDFNGFPMCSVGRMFLGTVVTKLVTKLDLQCAARLGNTGRYLIRSTGPARCGNEARLGADAITPVLLLNLHKVPAALANVLSHLLTYP